MVVHLQRYPLSVFSYCLSSFLCLGCFCVSAFEQQCVSPSSQQHEVRTQSVCVSLLSSALACFGFIKGCRSVSEKHMHTNKHRVETTVCTLVVFSQNPERYAELWGCLVVLYNVMVLENNTLFYGFTAVCLLMLLHYFIYSCWINHCLCLDMNENGQSVPFWSNFITMKPIYPGHKCCHLELVTSFWSQNSYLYMCPPNCELG